MGCGGCFPCFGSSNKEESNGGGSIPELGKQDSAKDDSVGQSHHVHRVSLDESKPQSGSDSKKKPAVSENGSTEYPTAQTFTFQELAAATENFRPECLLGEGGFGRVYKGRLESTGQVVAVKQLHGNGIQGNREFLVEILMLALLHHPNLVNLIGYCSDKFMSLGSLEDHLHGRKVFVGQTIVPFPVSLTPFPVSLTPGTHDDPYKSSPYVPPGKEPLDWNTRMKIAVGAAKGLKYLHDKVSPCVIHRNLKPSNMLLGEGYHLKLSDFGLAKLGPTSDKHHLSIRVRGTYGYCDPEYAMTGQLSVKSDVYSFGVVFLELITAIDDMRAPGEQNLVAWARPFFKDRRKFTEMADPLLQGRYPMQGLYQALDVAAMCLHEKAASRPLMGDVVTTLTYLAS